MGSHKEGVWGGGAQCIAIKKKFFIVSATIVVVALYGPETDVQGVAACCTDLVQNDFQTALPRQLLSPAAMMFWPMGTMSSDQSCAILVDRVSSAR